MSKKPVTISISSRQIDAGTSEETSQVLQGTLYERGGSNYLLFAEEGTSTTIRMDPDEIRLYRRGEVGGWQIFQLGELTGGLLSLGASDMILRVMTSHMSVTQASEEGRLELAYALYTGESAAPDADPTAVSLGQFVLAVDWHVLPGEATDGEPA